MKWQLKKIYVMLLTLFFLLAVVLTIRFDIFTIKKVSFRLENINCTDEKQIKDLLNLTRENFFLINAKKLEEILKSKFICIDKVSFSKYIPDTVGLTVFGRDPSAILINLKPKEATKSGQVEIENIATPSADDFNLGEKFLVDEEGVIFSKNIPDIPLPKIFFSGQELSLGNKLQGDMLNNALMIINKLKGFGIEVGNVNTMESRVLIVYSIPKIIFKLLDNIDVQLASLQLILEKAKIESNNLEFVDLRFDKPIVRFAPKK